MYVKITLINYDFFLAQQTLLILQMDIRDKKNKINLQAVSIDIETKGFLCTCCFALLKCTIIMSG